MKPSDEVRLQVSIIKPYEQDRGFSLSVSGVMWNHCMAPLPKDHDFPLSGSQQRTRDQLMMRYKLCQELGRMFADELERSIQKQDPKNGYAPGSMTRVEGMKP
ncbi:MAG: hypothetical protein ABIH23_00065 [bacterium]